MTKQVQRNQQILGLRVLIDSLIKIEDKRVDCIVQLYLDQFQQVSIQRLMKSEDYFQTPRGPLTQSQIKRNFFTQISKSEFDNLFTQQIFIASGTQGEVYSAFHEGQKVAIKKFRRESLSSQLIFYIQNEIQSLHEIRHPNILSLISTYQVVISTKCKKFCLVTEFCESNLNNLQKIQTLTEIQKMKICYQMMAGINAAHQRDVMHRDIKPQNILIKNLNTLEIKIGDFGCSRMGNDGSLTKYIGTPLYSDPNIKEGKYSVKCDIYSAGLVIVNIFCGRHFFSNCTLQEQLKAAKKKFAKDITVSAMNFLEEFNQSQVSDQIKTFLIDIAAFTMENAEQHRYSAQQLLQYIKNQLKNFENSDLQGQIIQQPDKYGKMTIQNPGDMKKKIISKFISQKQEGSSFEFPKIKKESPIKQNSQRFYSETPYDKWKSQSTIHTAENSQKIPTEKQFNKNQFFRQDVYFEDESNNSFQNSEYNLKNKFFDERERGYENDAESPTKSQKNNQNNSFISSDSNELEKRWNKEKAKVNTIKMSRTFKSTSEIIQSRVNQIRSKKSIEETLLRQKRIERKEKTLNDTEKFCAELIRCRFEYSGINQEGQAMKTLLATFILIKKNFEMVSKISQIIETPFTKEQKQIIAFLFHFLYAGKMKDFRSFVLGQPSNLKLEYVKVSSKRRETICQIVDKELIRVFDNMKNYSSDLKRKVDLIKPRLSDVARNCIDDAFRCTATADLLTKNYKENDIKQETRNFIEQKQAVTKNEKELEILKDLSKAIGRMCQ